MLPLALAGLVCFGSMKEDLDPARVAEIAAMLPDRPEGIGRPASDREAWAALAPLPSYASVVERAEPLLAQPIPEQPDDLYLEFSRTGNRTHWQDVAFERRARLTRLVLAECVEGQGRFLPPLEELIARLCEERTWVMPAHDGGLRNFRGEVTEIDLASSALGWGLALTDWLLADRLSPVTRELIHDNVRRRILDPFAAMVRGETGESWWMRTQNNWNAVCLAGVTGAALAAAETREERAWFLAATERYSRFFLTGFTPDGYCSEGVGYWDYGFGNYVLLADTVRRATSGGVDLLAVEGVLAPALYGSRIRIIGGVCPAFADCSVTATPDWRLMWYVNRRFGLGLPEYEGDPSTAGDSLPGCLIYSFSDVPAASPAESHPAAAELRTWFDAAGVLIARPAEGSGCRLGAALKGGNNAENHNHNDIGSFVVVLGERPILLDPGAETYSARTFSARRYESKLLNSFGHPVPVVAGKLQMTGRDSRAEVLETRFTDAEEVLSLDLSSGYVVDALKRLVRTFTYSREGAGSLTVTDDVAFSSPQAFGTALLTLGEWTQTGPAELEVADGAERVRVTIDAGGAAVRISAERIEEDAPVQPTRIGIDLVEPVSECRLTLRVTPLS